MIKRYYLLPLALSAGAALSSGLMAQEGPVPAASQSAAIEQKSWFATNSLLGIYSWNNHDQFFGVNTKSGQVFTLKFEHFDSWKYGDNFGFLDVDTGDLLAADGTRERDYLIYGEFHPRLSASKIFGTDIDLGPVTDVSLAGQVNASDRGFDAWLWGAGIDFDIPQFRFLRLGVYSRDDSFNDPTYQITLSWALPICLGAVDSSFEGFIDVAGSDKLGTDSNGRIRYLIDCSALSEHLKGLEAGAEVNFHTNRKLDSWAPGLMMRVKF